MGVDPLRSSETLQDAARRPAGEVLAALGSSDAGLSQEEARGRLRRWGQNRVPHPADVSLARKLFHQMFHFFAMVLWGAALLAFWGEMPALAIAIVVVIVVNGAFSFLQEYRAEKAALALAALVPEKATVRRAAHPLVVDAALLVPGDVMLLREGDRVSADARLLWSTALKVDMSMLTGESEPVACHAHPIALLPADVAQVKNLVFAGTFVTSGSGVAVVVSTGSRTRLGGISTLTSQVGARPTPLHQQLNQAVRSMAAIALTLGGLFCGVSLSLGTPWHDALLFSIGVVVALVPEGLLPTLSLSLAMSATRMAKGGVLVRRLESVETLGSTTVICTDKTGTVTRNEITARIVVTPELECTTSGSGYGPEGALLASSGRPLTDVEQQRLRPLLQAAALCGDARLDRGREMWHCVGDPTEAALLVLAQKGGVERTTLERSMPRKRAFPFESSRKRMSTVHQLASGDFAVLTKGSPEVILPLCDRDRAGRPLGDDERTQLMRQLEQMAQEGWRVLALAQKTMRGPLPQTAEEAETGLTYLGGVGMADPVRPEVPEAVRQARAAGIRIMMLTGDHPATALAIAKAAGMETTEVRLGPELPSEDAALAALIHPGLPIIARVTPEDKLRIARVLQELGEVVAMTGDGVNDTPALRQADIGIAMGKGGTDVARQAADLVLIDDNFAHIIEAVKEGRAAFANIRRFLTYHLTDNVAELTPFLVWALSAGEIPLMLSVLQVLALDIGTDLLPALALGAERPEASSMQRPPRAKHTHLLNRSVLLRAFAFLGPVEALLAMTILPLGAWHLFATSPAALTSATAEKATLSTLIFAAIVMMQMANAFACRSAHRSLFQIGVASNRLLLGAVLVEGIALLSFTYIPVLAHVLGHRPLGLDEWLLILPAPFLFLGAEELRKAMVRRRAGASTSLTSPRGTRASWRPPRLGPRSGTSRP